MNAEWIREYCLAKKAVGEGFPFDEDTLVFKVAGKMFLLLSLESSPAQFNVKCEPVKAAELREKYSFIKPGFHMSKTHWNTITCEKGVPVDLLRECIDDSYSLVVQGLPKKMKQQYGL